MMRGILGLSLLLGVAAPTYAQQVVITELMPNPDGSDTAEWVELQNIGDEVAEIGGWQLHDYSGSNPSTGLWAFPQGTTLAPLEVIIVARQNADPGFSRLGFGAASFEHGAALDDMSVPNMEDASGANRQMALSNGSSGDAVVLLGPEGDVMDAVEWGNDRPVAGRPFPRGPGEAQTLLRVATTGSSDTDFVIAQTPSPFIGMGNGAAPRIAQLQYAPRFASLADVLTVTASVTSEDELTRVELGLATASSSTADADAPYAMLAMMPGPGGSYSVTATLADLGLDAVVAYHDRFLRFYVVAENASATETTEPPEATADPENRAYVELNILPAAPTPIAAARQADAAGRVRYSGYAVRIRGVAQNAHFAFGDQRSQFTVADESGAIQIFDNEALQPDFAAGAELIVSGVLSQYYGMTQISGRPTIEVVGHGPVQPVQKTIGEVLGEGETLEGRMLELGAVSLVEPVDVWATDGPGGGVNYAITDGTGTMTLRLWSGSGLDGQATPAGAFTVRGVLGQFAEDGRTGNRGGYQLWPRGQNDFPQQMMGPDGGVMVEADAGSTTGDASSPDANTIPGGGDAGVGEPLASTDAGSDRGAPLDEPDPADEGCGCAAPPLSRSPSQWALVGLLVCGMTLRRRRQR